MVIECDDLVIGTRVFGKLAPDKYSTHLGPFVENAAEYGHGLIVSQRKYEYLPQLEDFIVDQVQRGRRLDIVCSETEGNKSPADMCNQVVIRAFDNEQGFFSIISSDLAVYIPKVLPLLLDYIANRPDLAAVGVAIQNVHDFELLDRIKKKGRSELNQENYARIYHNNAFSAYRLNLLQNGISIPLEHRLFPRDTDQGRLGTVDVDGKQVPIGGNEEIALAFQSLLVNIQLKTAFLAGPRHTIIRDQNQEISSVDAKILRRPLVARKYQERYRITDEVLRNYLDQNFEIVFEDLG